MRCISRTVATPRKWCANRRPAAWALRGQARVSARRRGLGGEPGGQDRGIDGWLPLRWPNVRATYASRTRRICRRMRWCRGLHRRRAPDLDPRCATPRTTTASRCRCLLHHVSRPGVEQEHEAAQGEVDHAAGSSHADADGVHAPNNGRQSGRPWRSRSCRAPDGSENPTKPAGSGRLSR